MFTVASETPPSDLTKLAAAQRQLDAAIRLVFAEDDEVAIHTLGAAAYAILRGLKRHHGRDELTDRFAWGIYAVADDLARGAVKSLPAEFDFPGLREIIGAVSAGIVAGEISNAEDVAKELRLGDQSEHWTRFNAPANFLKHADRDAEESFSTDRLDNQTLLQYACVAYLRLAGGSGTPEVIAYLVFAFGPSEGWSVKLNAIGELPPKERFQACRELLTELKTRGARAMLD